MSLTVTGGAGTGNVFLFYFTGLFGKPADHANSFMIWIQFRLELDYLKTIGYIKFMLILFEVSYHGFSMEEYYLK